MIKDFILPDIGEGIVECEIVEWLVEEGDSIAEDQPVVEIMTDKAVVQIPSSNSGKLVKFYYQKGEIAKVHTPLFAIETKATEQKESTLPSLETIVSIPQQPLEEKRTGESPVSISTSTGISRKKVLATPAVRRLGRELNIDLNKIAGSGKEGRILKEDLQQYQATQTPSVQPELPKLEKIEGRIEPLRGVKLSMARRMAEAAATIPHFGYGDEIDLTHLMELRSGLKSQLKTNGVNLSLMSFFMKALALAVREYPLLNSRLNAEATEIVYQDSCNIGMAVDTSIGLLVPNIKDVQNLSILQIAEEVQRLTHAAREGKVDQRDMQGGTITISNIGTIGGIWGIPIINLPEVAVVALGKVQTLPRYNSEGDVEPHQILLAHWSADHRIIDGGTMARFCNLWKQYLEDPSMMLIHLR